jgi:hypothetical protein
MLTCRPDRWRIIRVDLVNAFLSPRFLLSAVGVLAFCLLSVSQYMSFQRLETYSVLYVVDLLLGLSVFKKVVVIFAAVPFAAGFCSEWNTQYIRFLASRSGVVPYIWSKALVCLLSSFAVVCLGLLLFALLLSFFMPLLPDDPGAVASFPFAGFLTGAVPQAGLLSIVCIFALGNSLWVACGLTLSAYLPNRYLAVLSPFVFSYILENMTLGFPPWADLYVLTRAREVLDLGPLANLAYSVIFFGLLVFLCGLVFSHRVKQRVRNDVV